MSTTGNYKEQKRGERRRRSVFFLSFFPLPPRRLTREGKRRKNKGILIFSLKSKMKRKKKKGKKREIGAAPLDLSHPLFFKRINRRKKGKKKKRRGKGKKAL